MQGIVVATIVEFLGTPQPNSVKYFAAVDVLELTKDRSWLAKMTNTVSQHWRTKNQHKTARPWVEIGQPMEFSLPA